MTKAIRRQKQQKLRKLRNPRKPITKLTSPKKNQFTILKDVELSYKEDPFQWADTNLGLLYSLCDKSKGGIRRDQEIRADFLAKIFMNGKYKCLKLLDGDGRMLAQIIIAFRKYNLALPKITIVEIDEERHDYHRAQFPHCVEKEYGDIFSTAIDSTMYMYYNFCSIGFLVNQGYFMEKLKRTPNYMLGFTIEGSFRRKNTFGKKKKTQMKSVIPLLKKMQIVSKRGAFYMTVCI